MGTFVETPSSEIAQALSEFVHDVTGEQLRAWYESIPWLQDESRITVELEGRARDYTTILEYELPLEFRRPDVVVLQNGAVVVLELKAKAKPSRADLDQVAAYARDLRAYHRECHERPVYPVLVLGRARGLYSQLDGVRVVGPEALARTFVELSRSPGGKPIERAEFLRADAYSPMPTLVRAARELFQQGSLPRIRRAVANTQPALDATSAIAHEAARTRTRRLVLLSGVPGSGKTLVGLQLVHAGFLDDLASASGGEKPSSPAIYLSGNMSLVSVLQDALKGAGGGGRTFVRDVKGYVTTFSSGTHPPPHHLLVFDEAQRAWDATRVAKKHRGQSNHRGLSEPELFIEFAERVPDWCVVVALIGTGQEIHVGEEGGVAQWRAAVERARTRASWTVHAPPNLAAAFEGAPVALSIERPLNLDVELRYHGAEHLHAFVAALVSGESAAECRALADQVHEAGGRLLLTRDLEAAKGYVLERYRSFPGARYGVVASSRDKWFPASGLKLPPVNKMNVAGWFNREASDSGSCCALSVAASEFVCQGLELDFAIVSWGLDFARKQGTWTIERSSKYRDRVEAPHQLRANAYRVLLTRGRDGAVVFVPPDPFLDETFDHLRLAGFRDVRELALDGAD